MTASIKFNSTNTLFFPTLRKRVNQYFEENKISPTGNYKLFVKSGLLLAGLISCYIWLVFYTPGSILLALLLCSLMGVLFAAVGFNVMHDGSHGSYSNIGWLNIVMAHTLNLLGGSAYMWKHKHNFAHHSFTNIEGMDEDIDIKPFLRTNPNQKKYWFHRFQHIYSFLLYGLTYLVWIFFQDFRKYFSRKVTTLVDIPKLSLSQHIIFWVTKAVYATTIFILPIWQVGVIKTFLGYGMLVFVCGILIAIVFQLAHVHEEAAFVQPQGEPFIIENDWAIHQINTTANFATKQKWHNWFWGGLNFQIEHHLFPRISHIHYPAISKIVKQTCREFNIAYNEFPTVVSAIYSHITHLRKLGSSY